ncbi:MAG: hypothetical protein EOO88_57365, partial [Pedobacter sp.]
MKNKNITQIIFGIVLSAATISYAQDTGENGANRRVATTSTPANPRFGGVKGIFSEPTFNNPFTKTQEEHVDTPQMYLGFRSPMEVDTGVTWIPRLAPSGSENVDHSKWTLFIRGTGIAYKQFSYRGQPLLNERGKLGNVALELTVRPRIDGGGDNTPDSADGRNEAVLTAYTQGTMVGQAWSMGPGDDWTTIPNMHLLPTVQSPPNIQVKRVIAITQAATPANGATPAIRAYLDDSFLENAMFSEGYVKALRVNPNGTLQADGDWLDWDTVGGDGTHFFPWGRYGQPITANSSTPIADTTMPWVIAPRAPHTRYQQKTPSMGLPSNQSTLFR